MDCTSVSGVHRLWWWDCPALLLNAPMRLACVFFCAISQPVLADEPAPSFRNEVMAVLSKHGCNLGTCHGNQNGKGGFKLSLRGQHPDRDYRTLARDLGSRRVNVLEPGESLLLKKPLAEVPHQGGRRFERGSLAEVVLRNWIAAGMPLDAPGTAVPVELHLSPTRKTILAPEKSVQIVATARFSDGSSRDVTKLSVFEPSSLYVTVSPDGTATSERPGSSSVTVRYLDQQQPVRLEFVPQRDGFVWKAPEPANFIDEEIFATLRRTRVNPSQVCDDSSFVRRVFLDLTGLLPPAQKARDFVASTTPNKRAALIDELLDSPEFNDFQTLRWADLLRVEEKTLDKKGVEVFHDWIRTSFEQHKPLNQFAAEIIEARGSTYKQPPANFYRALRQPSTRAEATAQVFLGIRLQCAKCHNHPFDRWTQDDYYGWSNFFAHIDYKMEKNARKDKLDKHEFAGEQSVLISTKKKDVVNPATGKPAGLRYLGQNQANGAEGLKQDRLQKLAGWLTSEQNRRFAATQANRIWFQIMGRGIVDPVDDFRSTNPASHPELLSRLTDEFIEHNYDVRHLIRLIANSRTYQLAATTNETNIGDETAFSHTEPRRLTAEQTLDGIASVLGRSVRFDGHATGTKAVQLKGVRGGHRYSKTEAGDRFLLLFGKPGRLQTCECERNNATTLAQTFEMVSGELINQLVSNWATTFSLATARKEAPATTVENLYWAALSRGPTAKEKNGALKHIESNKNPRVGLQDLAWALLNSNEFLLRR